mgnify:CR=1 FL=1
MASASSRFFILTLLSVLAAHTAFAQDDSQANARALLEKAQTSLAVTVAAAQKDATLNLDDAKSKPFWDGVKDVKTNLENSKRDLENQDNRFFASLSSATAGYAQAEIALIMTGGDMGSMDFGDEW